MSNFPLFKRPENGVVGYINGWNLACRFFETHFHLFCKKNSQNFDILESTPFQSLQNSLFRFLRISPPCDIIRGKIFLYFFNVRYLFVFTKKNFEVCKQMKKVGLCTKGTLLVHIFSHPPQVPSDERLCRLWKC